MKEVTRNLLVGTFVIASFCVLGLLMVWFGEAPSWLGGSEWTLRITDVSGLNGLEEGSPVILNGVEIGRVKRLEFEDPSRPHQGVRIVAGIKNTFHVPRDAKARVYGATFGFGTGHIEIACDPRGDIEPLDRELAQIPGEMRSFIGELISSELVGSVDTAIKNIAALAAAAKPAMENLAALTEQRSPADLDPSKAAPEPMTPTITTMVARLEGLLANLNSVIGDENVQANVKDAVSDLRTAATDLRDTLAAFKTETERTSQNLNTGIDDTKRNLSKSFVTLNRALENLDEGLATLARLLLRVDKGEGTAGRFARDERLYDAAVIALERISELAGTLQRIFGKAETDGFITIGKATPMGTLHRDVPLEEFTRTIREELAASTNE